MSSSKKKTASPAKKSKALARKFSIEEKTAVNKSITKAKSSTNSKAIKAKSAKQKEPGSEIATRYNDIENQTKQRGAKFPIVAIGASAGGLEAFESFFKAMPLDSGMAFVLVAHLAPAHDSLLAELLQKCTQMKVEQIIDGTAVQPNRVYVIPPNRDLSILRGVLYLMELSQPRGSNMPINNFFRALAKDQGSNAVCIILSGTGSDGTLGLKAIKSELGMVMVQSAEVAKYDGMPRSAIATGLIDYVLPPDKMPEHLIRYAGHAVGKVVPKVEPKIGMVPNALHKIFIILRERTGHDFSLYKVNTISRRIERRMRVHQIDSLENYVRYLQESDLEATVLFKEILIGVTNFFRDPEAFQALAEKVLPGIFADKPNAYTVRVWVPGCSTGEEAYSIAILMHEYMEKVDAHFDVQIYGTDIDKDAIKHARKGRYPESISADINTARRKRYFTKEEDSQYQVKKEIREMVVFASQNVIKDPPFTKLDLISCRNLMIYLGPELQRKLVPIFHYSLKPNGALFLGPSEATGQGTHLFDSIDRKWRLFMRKATTALGNPAPEFPAIKYVREPIETQIPVQLKQAEKISDVQLIEAILNQSDTPPCAIIDELCSIVYIHGRIGRFLELAEGKSTLNVIEMARAGLKAALSAAIRQVVIHQQQVVRKGIRVQTNGDQAHVDLTVKPIHEGIPIHHLMMVVFEEVKAPNVSAEAKVKQSVSKTLRKSTEELEQELQDMRESLQSTIEELETSNEELKSTNEELQSTNEELQSTNEEIETSKEELQSLNEESMTVNSELQGRIEELNTAQDDLKNLLNCTGIATLFLDTEARIRRFTPKATEIIPLAGTDVGRSIGDLSTRLINVDLKDAAEKVLINLGTVELEVMSSDNRCYTMRVQPYRTLANVIDGVAITFEDISKGRAMEREVRQTLEQWRVLTECSADHIMLLDPDGIIRFTNRAVPGLLDKHIVGSSVFDLVPENQRHAMKSVLKFVLETGRFSRYEADYTTPLGDTRRYEGRVGRVMREGEAVSLIVSASDMTLIPGNRGEAALETTQDAQPDETG